MSTKVLSPNKCVTTFGKSTKFNGELKFTTSLNIKGNFSGDIKSEGFLYIDKTGVVNADIKAESVVVAGCVYGDITAAERVEITSTGVVKGNIDSAVVKMADGHEFCGNCKMLDNIDSVDVFSASTDKLKRMLSGA